MTIDKKNIKVALVRADSFTEYENKLWEQLDPRFKITGFTSKNKLYDTSTLRLPMEHLRSTKDHFLTNIYSVYVRGRYKMMYGLEEKIKNFDIVHTAEVFNYYTYQALEAKKRYPHLKIVATVWDNIFARFEYGYWPGCTKPPKFWITRLHRIMDAAYAGVDMFFPVSNMAAGVLSSNGVPDHKIEVITPGIIETGKKSDIRGKLKLKSDVVLYTTICRLTKEKGIFDILAAWRLYQQKHHKKTMLVIVGNGPEKENVLRLIKLWDLESTVVCAGKLTNSEIHDLLKESKVSLLGSIPSATWQEQFGYVLAESIVNECPVISTVSGAIPETVGNAGILVPPASPVDIYQALLRIDEPAEYQKYKDATRKEKERFAEKKFADKLSEAYLKIVS